MDATTGQLPTVTEGAAVIHGVDDAPPRALASVTTPAFPAASLRDVVVSKKARAQFMVQLTMRFMALKDLKNLDHSINARDLVFGKKLGGGSFGNVYMAKLRGLDVAAKVLKGSVTNEAILNLKIEVETLERLRHPHIMLYIGMAQTNTFAAMITEYCELGSLHDLLHNYRFEINAKRLLHFALEVAEGMWYLHSMEKLLIIHRDIKSANILVTSNYKLKIADFGLAVMQPRDLDLAPGEDQVADHGYCGTPQFMAPEILMRDEQQYGQKCDVYSFGVMLTEFATRRMPWLDRYRHLDFIPAVLERGERPTYPKYMSADATQCRASELGDVIRACLEQNAADRPPFCDLIPKLERIYALVAEDELYLLTHFEIPRFLEALGESAFVEDLGLVARELVQLLESASTSTASIVVASEKLQVLQIVADQFMQLLLQRIGSGKSRRICEVEDKPEVSGGEVETVDIPLEVLEDLVYSLRMLSECVNRQLPSILQLDQLQSLITLFFRLEDNDGRGIRACGELLRQLCHCSPVFQSSLEEHLASSGAAKASKERRCAKYGVLLFAVNQVEVEIAALQRAVEEMELELFQKKKRLMELRFNSNLVLLKRRTTQEESATAT